VNWFRLDNYAADCVVGVRILSVFHHQPGNHINPFYQASGCDEGSDFVPPVNILNRWIYVTQSVSVSGNSYLYQHCYGIFGNEHIWYCKDTTRVGTWETFGSSASSNIAIGDVYHGLMIGQVADNRIYWNSALNFTQFEEFYNNRLTYCSENCLTCLGPFECGTCQPGFYLSNVPDVIAAVLPVQVPPIQLAVSVLQSVN